MGGFVFRKYERLVRCHDLIHIAELHAGKIVEKDINVRINRKIIDISFLL